MLDAAVNDCYYTTYLQRSDEAKVFQILSLTIVILCRENGKLLSITFPS